MAESYGIDLYWLPLGPRRTLGAAERPGLRGERRSPARSCAAANARTSPRSKTDSNAAPKRTEVAVNDHDDADSPTQPARPVRALRAALLRDVRADVRRLRDRRPHLLLGREQVRLLAPLQGVARAVCRDRDVHDDGADGRLDGVPRHGASTDRGDGGRHAHTRRGTAPSRLALVGADGRSCPLGA